jgi:hypothetical protein
MGGKQSFINMNHRYQHKLVHKEFYILVKAFVGEMKNTCRTHLVYVEQVRGVVQNKM